MDALIKNTIMKSKKIIYGFFLFIIIISSCRKSDNPGLPDGLQRAPIPQLSKDSSGDLAISSQDIDGFTGKVVLNQYYTTDHSYKSINAVVIKNGDATNVQVLQADITSLPATVTFTSAQLAKLFNSAVAPGDNYTISEDIILPSGQKIEAFPADGNPNFDPNIPALPNLGATTISYAVFCPYDPNLYNGDFVVIEDDWQDYQPNDVIPVTKIDATHFSFEYNDLDAQPIIITVDPTNNTTSVSNQPFGNYGAGTGNFFIHSLASPNNYVIPCNGTVSIVTDISSDVLGDFGTVRLVLQKK